MGVLSRDRLRSFADRNSGLLCVLNGLVFIGLPYLIYRHQVSPSPAGFLAYLADPARVVVFAREPYNQIYQMWAGMFTFAGWAVVWAGLVERIWTAFCRSPAIRLLAFLLLVLPGALPLFWSTAGDVRILTVLYNLLLTGILVRDVLTAAGSERYKQGVAAVKGWLRRIEMEHHALVGVLGGLAFIALTYLVYGHYVAGASPAGFLAYLLDPGKVAVLPVRCANLCFQFCAAVFVLTGWTMVWHSAAYTWGLYKRPAVVQLVALFLLVAPAGFAVFFWHTMWFVRAGIGLWYLIILAMVLYWLIA